MKKKDDKSHVLAVRISKEMHRLIKKKNLDVASAIREFLKRELGII